MGGDGKTCQTDKNTSLSPFATRFEGRTRRTPTFKGCTELEKENKGYEGSLGEARSLREESSSTRREWPKANSRRSDRLPLFRVPITHPHLDQRGCEPWLGHCRFCHPPSRACFLLCEMRILIEHPPHRMTERCKMELRNAYLPRCLAHSKCSVMVLAEEITVVVESRGSALIGQKIELINLAPFIHSFIHGLLYISPYARHSRCQGN